MAKTKSQPVPVSTQLLARYRDLRPTYWVTFLGASCKKPLYLAARSTSPDRQVLYLVPDSTSEGNVTPNLSLRPSGAFAGICLLCFRFNLNVPNRTSISRAGDRAEKLSAAMAAGGRQRWSGGVAPAAARADGVGGVRAAAGAGGSVLSEGSVRWELQLAIRKKEESEQMS